MTDLNIRDFNRRLARIDKIHKAGGAFEASGTIGRSYYSSLQPTRRGGFSVIKPLACVLAAVLLFKGAIYGQLGEVTYNARVADLAQGNTADQIGAWMMTADTATIAIGDALHRFAY